MFIDFEGIDGSGKTTLSNLLAERLRKLGHKVTHAREGGELKSPIARRLRELTRDQSFFEMGTRTELLLNLARDAQQLEEVIRPALERGEVCIGDRYVYSQLTHSGDGRGLSLTQLAPLAEFAAHGLWPDLVVLVDVDPELARLRKRAGRGGDEETREGSRKGLAGAGLANRVREGFLRLAASEPSRWVVVENEGVTLGALADRLVEVVRARMEGSGPQQASSGVQKVRGPAVGLDRLEEAFFAAVDDLEVREPGLALYLLCGVPGLAAHQRRVRHLEERPAQVARSLDGVVDDDAHRIREILGAVRPKEVLQSLGRDVSPRAMKLRQLLFDQAPAQAVQGLKGCDLAPAWALRERALRMGELGPVLIGLCGLDDERSWRLRRLGQEAGLSKQVARSLVELEGQRAQALREALFEEVPLAVLKTLDGVDSPFARKVREALFDHAPKPVLRTLAGVDAPYAWALRVRAAPLTREALDAVDGMDQPEAWALRERFAGQWPCTALSSLRQLAQTEAGERLLVRVLQENPGRVPVLRSAYSVLHRRWGSARAIRTERAQSSLEAP